MFVPCDLEEVASPFCNSVSSSIRWDSNYDNLFRGCCRLGHETAGSPALATQLVPDHTQSTRSSCDLVSSRDLSSLIPTHPLKSCSGSTITEGLLGTVFGSSHLTQKRSKVHVISPILKIRKLRLREARRFPQPKVQACSRSLG